MATQIRKRFPESSAQLTPPCKNCIHLTSEGGNREVAGWTCSAFPLGIPVMILNRSLPHVTSLDVYPGQQGEFLYESKVIDGHIITFNGETKEIKSDG